MESGGRSILREVCAATRLEHSEHYARHLHTTLHQSVSLLAKPLETSRPNAADKATVESGQLTRDGQKRRLTPDFAATALTLSQQLNINELEAVDLLSRAYQLQPRFPGVAPLAIAETQFYEHRDACLRSLLDLFAFRAASEYTIPPSPAAAVISAFTTKLLISQHIFRYIVTTVRSHLEQGGGFSVTAQRHRRSELSLLCQLVFSLTYTCAAHLAETDIQALVELVRFSSDRLAASQLESFPGVPLSTLSPQMPCNDAHLSLVHSTCLLTTALVALLDPLGTSPSESAATVTILLKSDGFFQQFVVSNTPRWQHAPLRGVILLAGSLALVHHPNHAARDRQINDYVHDSINTSCFLVLEQIASCLVDAFPTPHTYLSALEETFVAFLQGMPQYVRDLKQEEEESIRKVQIFNNYPYGQAPPEPTRHFEQLLASLAHVYECLTGSIQQQNQLDALTSRYWDGGQFPELNQFLRSCGDNIFQDIFVPFLRFLKAVANGPFQAVKAHEFLCERRPYVNWDSFFAVLRNTAIAFQDTMSLPGTSTTSSAANGAPVVALRPEDLHGMTAIVQLISTVIQHNDAARHFLISSGMSPLETLFSLLACPVPPEFKAALLKATQSFSVDTELAAKVWQLMSSIQILPAPPTIGGIRLELADIESSNETYPCTSSFLKLLHRLTCVCISSPSVVPTAQELWQYVGFVEKDILSAVDGRSYKHAHERWDITLDALLILTRLVDAAQSSFFLQPSFHDMLTNSAISKDAHGSMSTEKLNSVFSLFQESTITRLAAEPPAVLVGLRMMSGMLVPGNHITKKLLAIIGIGVDSITDQRDKPRGLVLEKCVLAALSILHAVMRNQGLFLSNYDLFAHAWTKSVSSSARNQPASTPQNALTLTAYRASLELGTAPLEPLDRQLLAQPDNLVSLLRFVEYPFNEQINCLCIKITELLCSKGELSASVVRLLIDRQQQPHLIAAYAQLLDLPDGSYPSLPLEVDHSSSAFEPEPANSAPTADSLRTIAVSLLTACAKQPAPNLAQLLIGLNPITSSFVNQSQLAIAETTPLETVFRLLGDPELGLHQPQLSTASYQLLFTLLQQAPTRSRIATYLRSRHQDFFCIQLFQVILQSPPSVSDSAERLEGMGWLLKTIALELHLTRGTGHRTYTQRLLALLFGLQTQADSNGTSAASASDSSSQSQLQFQYGQDVQQQRMKMRELLEAALDFLQNNEVPPDASVVWKSPLLQHVDLTQATLIDSLHVPLIDVKELAVLIRDAAQPSARDPESESYSFGNQASFLGAAGPAQPFIPNSSLAENASSKLARAEAFSIQLRAVLQQVVIINKYQKCVGALCHAFEGWKEVLAVTMGECFHLLETPTRTAALFELQDVLLQYLHQLLYLTSEIGGDSVIESHLSRRLGVPMSQCIALLLAKLRQQMLTSIGGATSDARSTSVHAPRFDSLQAEGLPPSDQLVVLLHGLVRCLVVCKNYLPLRLNLYTALLHFLQAVVRLRDATNAEEFRVVFSDSASILRRNGAGLVDMIASDACDASDGQKLVPLGLLAVILPHYDTDGSWLEYLSRNNYIHQFVDHVIRQDHNLVLGDARAVYVYESEMALLTAVAMSPAESADRLPTSCRAAEVLVENKVFLMLGRCSFMEQRPEDRTTEDRVVQSPSLDIERVPHRLDLLLQAMLRLCKAVLLRMDRNEEAAKQIAYLFVEHSEAFIAVLKDPYSMSLESLMSSSANADRLNGVKMALSTLAEVTSVLTSLAHFPHLMRSLMDKRLSQFDQLQLELLAKYTAIEERLFRLNRSVTLSAEKLRPSINLIVHNLLAYFRVRCSAVPSETSGSNLSAAPASFFALSSSNSRQPNINVLYSLLNHSIVHLESTMGKVSEMSSFQAKIDTARVEELSEQVDRLRASGQLDPIDFMAQAAVVAPYQSQYRYAHSQERDILADFTVPQRLRLVKRIWSDQIDSLNQHASLHTVNIEQILFLVWKHVHLFLSSSPPQSTLSTKERDSLRSDLSSKVIPSLERLVSLHSTSSLIQAMFSRFRDIIQKPHLFRK